jgi:glycosyltransferase involved in cell wall biosynthesis
MAPSNIGERGPEGVREELEVTFFIPCLNEERHVAATLETVVAAAAEFPWTYEVIVVDDGSTDRTADIVADFCRAHAALPVRLVRNASNLGLARSFLDAAFRGRGRYYRLICGDNIEPKASMAAVLRHMGEADIVMPYYPDIPGKSAVGRTLSRVYNGLINLISGHRIRYYNGNPLYRRHQVMRWAPHGNGFGYQADLVTQLLDLDCTYVEVPVAGIHRPKAGSSLRIRSLMSVAHSLLEIAFRRLRAIFLKR